MQQRQLRLGDILDDYCPRERRLANHTIVAMVGNDIRLTRCTTCDTEHPYKGGKVPRLRKKKTSVEVFLDQTEKLKALIAEREEGLKTLKAAALEMLESEHKKQVKIEELDKNFED